MSAVRVLIVDDQRIIRDGLSTLLGLLDGIEVVGTAVDGADAVRQAAALRPDVVLLDLNMPVMGGIEATSRLLEADASVRIVVLTTFADDASVFDALRAGARGFLTKDADAQQIQHAIRTVAAGEAQLDPSVQRRLLEELGRPRAATPAPEPLPHGLTAREIDVLSSIADGLSNGEIARRMYIGEATVKTHVNHLLAKTGLRDRAQLVAYAFRHGVAPRNGG